MSSNNQAQNLAAQMQFGPLLYSYQLAMAQAAAAAQQQQAPSTKGKCRFQVSSLTKFKANYCVYFYSLSFIQAEQ